MTETAEKKARADVRKAQAEFERNTAAAGAIELDRGGEPAPFASLRTLVGFSLCSPGIFDGLAALGL